MKKPEESVLQTLVDKGLKLADLTQASEQMWAYFKKVRALESALPTKVNTYRGRGNERADILIISDAPDQCEQQTGLVGFSGYPIILTMFLNRLGVNFEEAYWTTAIKRIHPRVNMSIIKDEFVHLKEEITYINPSVIIALGTTPISSLAGEPIKIDKAVGKDFSYDIHQAFPSIPVIPIYHPRTFNDMEEDEFRQVIKETWQSLKSIDSLL